MFFVLMTCAVAILAGVIWLLWDQPLVVRARAAPVTVLVTGAVAFATVTQPQIHVIFTDVGVGPWTSWSGSTHAHVWWQALVWTLAWYGYLLSVLVVTRLALGGAAYVPGTSSGPLTPALRMAREGLEVLTYSLAWPAKGRYRAALAVALFFLLMAVPFVVPGALERYGWDAQGYTSVIAFSAFGTAAAVAGRLLARPKRADREGRALGEAWALTTSAVIVLLCLTEAVWVAASEQALFVTARNHYAAVLITVGGAMIAFASLVDRSLRQPVRPDPASFAPAGILFLVLAGNDVLEWARAPLHRFVGSEDESSLAAGPSSGSGGAGPQDTQPFGCNPGDSPRIALNWLQHVHDRLATIPEEGPVFVVAASGGGSRAALYAGLTLAWMRNSSVRCGAENLNESLSFLNPTPDGTRLDQHILLISSVSGGSLGAGHYWTQPEAFDLPPLPEAGPDAGRSRCAPPAARADGTAPAAGPAHASLTELCPSARFANIEPSWVEGTYGWLLDRVRQTRPDEILFEAAWKTIRGSHLEAVQARVGERLKAEGYTPDSDRWVERRSFLETQELDLLMNRSEQVRKVEALVTAYRASGRDACGSGAPSETPKDPELALLLDTMAIHASVIELDDTFPRAPSGFRPLGLRAMCAPFFDNLAQNFASPTVRGAVLPLSSRGEQLAQTWRRLGILEDTPTLHDPAWHDPSTRDASKPLLAVNAFDMRSGGRAAIGVPAFPPWLLRGNTANVRDGYASPPVAPLDIGLGLDLGLVDAVRASAAVPSLFNPVLVETSCDPEADGSAWSSAMQGALTMLDGGAYDNTGIDTLFALWGVLRSEERQASFVEDVFGNSDARQREAAEKLMAAIGEAIEQRGGLVLIEVDSSARPPSTDPGASTHLAEEAAEDLPNPHRVDVQEGLNAWGRAQFQHARASTLSRLTSMATAPGRGQIPHMNPWPSIDEHGDRVVRLVYAASRAGRAEHDVMTFWALGSTDLAYLLYLFDDARLRVEQDFRQEVTAACTRAAQAKPTAVSGPTAHVAWAPSKTPIHVYACPGADPQEAGGTSLPTHVYENLRRGIFDPEIFPELLTWSEGAFHPRVPPPPKAPTRPTLVSDVSDKRLRTAIAALDQPAADGRPSPLVALAAKDPEAVALARVWKLVSDSGSPTWRTAPRTPDWPPGISIVSCPATPNAPPPKK